MSDSSPQQTPGPSPEQTPEQPPELGPELRAWVGRQQSQSDRADLGRAAALQATLESPAAPLTEGAALPELWHWIYFWEVAALSRLGPDGHAARGQFLPPIDLPRRMWAGSRVSWQRPIRIGAVLTKRSEIAAITLKQGRSGPLAFVTLRHEVADAEGAVLAEEQDIVYRAAAKPGEAARAGAASARTPVWSRALHPDPVLLFRYSALTFNGHRIHYDQPYVTGVEGYPGLIVHGPLLATLMVDLARREAPERRIAAFRFRALAPVFDTAPFTVCGAPDAGAAPAGADLWVEGPDRQLCMQGRVDWAA